MPPTCLEPELELDRYVSALERGWQAGENVLLANYLPSHDNPLYERILSELIRVDLEYQWSRGDRKQLIEYCQEYPELFKNAVVVQQLVFEEYRQCIQAGVPVKFEEYRELYGVDLSDLTDASAKSGLVECESRREKNRTEADKRTVILEQLRIARPLTAQRLENAFEQMPGLGQHIFGFKLADDLGEGSFAKVFLAHQEELADRPVVLKISPSLHDEPRKLARLQHTNIVPIFSVHRLGNLQAVCMPYLGATTLADVVKNLTKNNGSLPETGRGLLSTLFDPPKTVVGSDPLLAASRPSKDDGALATPILDMMCSFSHIEAVLWMGARLCDGLAHAHERGILHLDLKPANILISDDGQPILLDFNLAIDLNIVASLEMSRMGGTLPYMSPEQMEAFQNRTRNIDARSDLYSLGLILFEILTGVSPFPKRVGRIDEIIAMMRADRQSAPSPRQINPAISPAVDSIIRKLLDPDPARRYANAVQPREDFERQLANRPLLYAPDRSIPERFRKWRKRHPRLASACLVSLVAFLFLLLPASVVAVRQHQIAERLSQIEKAEAGQLWLEAGKEARTVQVLLATKTGDRPLLDQGIERGKKVLEKFSVDKNGDWMKGPLFSRLSEVQQEQLRFDLGEMLLFMSRGEQIRASDSRESEAEKEGLQTALHWNLLAQKCYPSGHLPQLLAKQRAGLLKALPDRAHEVQPLVIDGAATSDYDLYHEGITLAMQGQYREALASLIPFTEEHPQHFQAWFVRGLCHEALGENAESAACWTGCIAVDPEMPWTYFNRGIVRLHQRDFSRAKDDFQRALELQPNWLDALINRAIALQEMHDYAAAIRDLDDVLKSPHAPVRAWFLRANAKERARDPAGAKRDRLEGMRKEPTDDISWSTRGFTRMTSEPEEALKDFDKAIALNPRALEALLNKSIVLSESLQRPREAVEALDLLLEHFPDHVGARAGRGVVLARMGECERARQDAEECLKRERSAFFLFQIAGIYAQISRHEREPVAAKREAIWLLGRALQKGFNDLNLLKSDSDLDPIRNDVGFKVLLEIAAGLQKSAQR